MASSPENPKTKVRGHPTEQQKILFCVSFKQDARNKEMGESNFIYHISAFLFFVYQHLSCSLT